MQSGSATKSGTPNYARRSVIEMPRLSRETNSVPTLDTPFADPDTEALRAKVNEMLNVMRR